MIEPNMFRHSHRGARALRFAFIALLTSAGSFYLATDLTSGGTRAEAAEVAVPAASRLLAAAAPLPAATTPPPAATPAPASVVGPLPRKDLSKPEKHAKLIDEFFAEHQ